MAEGRLDPQSTYKLKDSDREGTTPYHTGILRDFHEGLELTLEDIVRMNIVLSDDTAANILLRMFGLGCIQEDIRELGLTNTRFDRIMNDYQGAREGRENYTSCRDVANFYRELLYGNRLPRPLCDKMLEILAQQRYTYGLDTPEEINTFVEDYREMAGDDPVLVITTVNSEVKRAEPSIVNPPQ